jgi:hypothetical protein
MADWLATSWSDSLIMVVEVKGCEMNVSVIAIVFFILLM